MSDKISISTQEIEAQIVKFDEIIAKNDEVLNLITSGLQTLLDAGMMTISANAIAKIKNLKQTIEREKQILNDGKTALINSKATYENLDISLRKLIEDSIGNGGEDIYGAESINATTPSTQVVVKVWGPNEAVNRDGYMYKGTVTYVTDFSSPYYSQIAQGGNYGGNLQCTDYAEARISEIIGKPIVSNYEGKLYPVADASQLASTLVGRLNEGINAEYISAEGFDITKLKTPAISSCARANHVTVIEQVVVEDGVPYVYFSEGNSVGNVNGIRGTITDGMLQRMPYSSFCQLDLCCPSGFLQFGK